MAVIIGAVVGVWMVLFVVPMLVYGITAASLGLKTPGAGSPTRFLLGVAVAKLGTAVVFVALFRLSQPVFAERWVLYAFLWFVMFAGDEGGQVLSGTQSKMEAAAGIISEAIYFPTAAFLVRILLG